MTDAQRAILERVASGELDPQAATRLLDDLAATHDDPTATTELPDDDRSDPEEREPEAAPKSGDISGGRPDDSEPVRGVRVVASAGSVRVIGDPLVARIAVDGPHTMRRAGDIVVVECSPLLDVLSLEHGLGRFITSGPGHVRPRFRGGRPVVVVRVNPDLPLDLDVTAGHAVVSGSTKGVRCSVSAGSAVLRDMTGPVEASVTAGSLALSGPLRHGASRINCDMGSATVRLESGADVRVRVRNNLGKVSVDLPGCEHEDEAFVVGTGLAELNIESNLSSVTVSADDV